GMPVGGTGAARGAATGPRYGFKPTIMARPLPAG
ncbi:PPE family protein, SVP subgroup, partial [Mycobacterium conspicuum]